VKLYSILTLHTFTPRSH